MRITLLERSVIWLQKISPETVKPFLKTLLHLKSQFFGKFTSCKSQNWEKVLKLNIWSNLWRSHTITKWNVTTTKCILIFLLANSLNMYPHQILSIPIYGSTCQHKFKNTNSQLQDEFAFTDIIMMSKLSSLSNTKLQFSVVIFFLFEFAHTKAYLLGNYKST